MVPVIVNLLSPSIFCVVSAIPTPATIFTVSRPSASNVSCPATSQYLNVLLRAICTAPSPKSDTANPESVSKRIAFTFVI